jgi:hypothetical protein
MRQRPPRLLIRIRDHGLQEISAVCTVGLRRAAVHVNSPICMTAVYGWPIAPIVVGEIKDSSNGLFT